MKYVLIVALVLFVLTFLVSTIIQLVKKHKEVKNNIRKKN